MKNKIALKNNDLLQSIEDVKLFSENLGYTDTPEVRLAILDQLPISKSSHLSQEHLLPFFIENSLQALYKSHELDYKIIKSYNQLLGSIGRFRKNKVHVSNWHLPTSTAGLNRIAYFESFLSKDFKATDIPDYFNIINAQGRFFIEHPLDEGSTMNLPISDIALLCDNLKVYDKNIILEFLYISTNFEGYTDELKLSYLTANKLDRPYLLKFKKVINIKNWEIKLSPRVLRALNKIPEKLRYSLLPERGTQVIHPRELNWDAYAAAKVSPVARFRSYPFELAWKYMLGPAYYAPSIGRSLESFKSKVFRKIYDELSFIKNTQDCVQSSEEATYLFKLVYLFKDYNTIFNWVTKTNKNPWSIKGIHDSAMFILPQDESQPDINYLRELVLHSPECIKHIHVLCGHDFNALSYKPKNLTEVCEFAEMGIQLSEVPDNFKQLFLKIRAHRLAKTAYASAVDFISENSAKTHEMIPHVRITSEDLGLSSGLVLRSLAFNDPIGLILGQLTGCCQHLEGMGSASAKGGFQLASQCFWIVEQGSKVVAQSWLWRNTSDGVVIDSVEMNRCYIKLLPDLANLYAAAAAALKGRLCIKDVFIGKTMSGYTSHVSKKLKLVLRPVSTTPLDKVGYFDGTSHQKIKNK